MQNSAPYLRRGVLCGFTVSVTLLCFAKNCVINSACNTCRVPPFALFCTCTKPDCRGGFYIASGGLMHFRIGVLFCNCRVKAFFIRKTCRFKVFDKTILSANSAVLLSTEQRFFPGTSAVFRLRMNFSHLFCVVSPKCRCETGFGGRLKIFCAVSVRFHRRVAAPVSVTVPYLQDADYRLSSR